MNNVLLDTSAWIDYFEGAKHTPQIDSLLDDRAVCINKIIICELYPFLHVNKQFELLDLLKAVPEIPLTIDWDKIISYQTTILKNSIKRIGIPDLIILDNAIQTDISILTLDKPLLQLKSIIKFKVI
ncbi:MAG: PIN domain-containing protein [Bacteroidales bacterium]|nr:PIN domain-containing protein [Bacteroidales bacterium]